MGKYVFTFGTYAKTTRNGHSQYVYEVGNFVMNDSTLNGISSNTAENRLIFAIESIANFIHCAPCDVFIEAINYQPLEKPVGLYGELEA